MKKKLLLYPYDYQVDVLIDYQQYIAKFDVIGVSSIKEDTHYLGNKYPNLFCMYEKQLEIADNVLFLDNIRKLRVECYIDKIHKAILLGKNVMMSDELKNEVEKYMGETLKGIIVTNEVSKNKKNYECVMLQDINVPIVAVLGMGKECSKFEMTVCGNNYFKEKGYKVLTISENSLSFLFGIEKYPDFIFDTHMQLFQKVLAFNNYIAEQVATVKPDIIILGIPGGIMPINKYLHNYFGEFTYMVCNALKVDIGILCSYYAQNIDSGYVSEIERLCAYRYNIPQVNFYISENKMKTDSENKLEIGIYRLGKNIIDSLNISNHNLQNVKSCFDNNNSLEELWYQVECKLAENVECIV